MKISPSILSLDFTKFDEQLEILNKNAEYIHFDVMDGNFVPNLTFGPKILDAFNKKSDLIMDVHLMISNPGKYFYDYILAGADIITFHIESLGNNIKKASGLIADIKGCKVKAGISINPKTDIKLIEPLLKDLDLVLVMSVEPGFGGQSFMEDSLDKVKYLKEQKDLNNYNYIIEIDGGINEKNAKLAKKAGVELLVAGSFVFKGDIASNINILKNI